MDEFARWADAPDAAIDLSRAALAIARDEYPDLDADRCLAQLDGMADRIRLAVRRSPDAGALRSALDRQLFRVDGFRGNARDYYDPRNSYLNDVLERRLGIPISLCVLYVEVGRRLGLTLDPVGFPGHFLVASGVPDAREYIDPFHAGRRLSSPDLMAQLEALVGAEAAPAAFPGAVAPVPRREVVARMLRNLKAIHVGAADWPRALRVTDRLVTLTPDSPAELRDRGRIYEHLEAHRSACEDYARYLQRFPDAGDAAAVRQRLAALRPGAGRLN